MECAQGWTSRSGDSRRIDGQGRPAVPETLGRPFSLWALDRLIASARDTQREFGAIGSNGVDLLRGPVLDEETRRAVHLRRTIAI